jgi:hypothetical protein
MSPAPNYEVGPQPSPVIRKLFFAISLWLLACAAAFVALSWHWPMVGNVTYMHYVVFLMRHGMVPYRDIIEMNLPGSYLIESAVMSLLGPGSIGWRIYDLLLLAVASVSMVAILRPHGRAAGIFAAVLFLMIHAQDGVIMTGERDFAVAVFLLAATALLFFAIRRARTDLASSIAESLAIFGFGALAGFAITIKPTVIPVALCLFLWALWMLRRRVGPSLSFILITIAGFLLPVAITLVFLTREGATAAFLAALRGIIPYHASLAHRPLGFLLLHCVSPILALAILWIAAAVFSTRGNAGPERIALFLCVACGLLSFLVQAKGFAYQRYPFIAFLCVLIAADLTRLARQRDAIRWLGIGGLITGTLLCTSCLIRAASFDRRDPARPLLADLQSLGVADRSVQCMDTGGSCIDDLYAGRIVQSTGLIYDCYLLDGTNPVALSLRQRFWEQIARNPPRLVVVTGSACYEVAPNSNKYAKWPEFTAWLDANYTLARVSGPQPQLHYWSRRQTPFAYRIYIRR